MQHNTVVLFSPPGRIHQSCAQCGAALAANAQRARGRDGTTVLCCSNLRSCSTRLSTDTLVVATEQARLASWQPGTPPDPCPDAIGYDPHDAKAG